MERLDPNDLNAFLEELKKELKELYENRTADLHPFDQEWIDLEYGRRFINQ